jgi:short-subunit dehydrogenase
MGVLEGAVTLLTGAAGGIGAELSRVVSERGAEVVLTDRDPDRLAEVGARVPGSEQAVLDVTDADACRRTVDDVLERHGRLDVVIAGAGIGVAGDAHEIPLASWRASVEVNLMGTVNVVHAAYPHLVAAGRGRLGLIASLSGLVPTPLLAPYSTTKHALVGLGLALRTEAAVHGVTVTTLCPGPVDTALLDQAAPPDLEAVARPPDPRRYLTRLAGRPMKPAAFAEAAVSAVERGRALVVVPGRSRAVALLQRLAPGAVARVGTKELARERGLAG